MLYLSYNYTIDSRIRVAHKLDYILLYFSLFTDNGQIPILDGLFGQPLLAYFSGQPVGLKSVRICGAL